MIALFFISTYNFLYVFILNYKKVKIFLKKVFTNLEKVL